MIAFRVLRRAAKMIRTCKPQRKGMNSGTSGKAGGKDDEKRTIL